MICYRGFFISLLVDWLLVTVTVSEIYTKSYDGYVFTSPGLSAFRNRDEAQALCALNGSKLLEINSSYLQTLTVRFLSESGIDIRDRDLVLTNGIRNGGNWNWVNGQVRNSVVVGGQGQGLAYSFGYINLNASGLYITASTPIEMRSYICQGKFDCSNGFLIKELCHKSYSSPTMSWFDARNRCLDEGGDLASFDFINDDQGLKILNGSWLSSSTTYWIGIRRQWWTWQTSNLPSVRPNDLEVRYSHWQIGRPLYNENDRCLCLYKSDNDWKWIECSCSAQYAFVCLRVQSSTSSSTAQVTSTSATTNTLTPSGVTSTAVTNLNQPTMEPSLSTALTLNSTGDNNLGTRLGIGLGVGIGGGLIIAAIIIIVVFLVIRKPGCLRKTNPPDVTLHPVDSHYAEISKQPGYESTSPQDANGNQFSQPVVYSDLEIFVGSSLISSKTATLAPPITHKTTTHFTVDGQEYAEVKEIRI